MWLGVGSVRQSSRVRQTPNCESQMTAAAAGATVGAAATAVATAATAYPPRTGGKAQEMCGQPCVGADVAGQCGQPCVGAADDQSRNAGASARE